MVASLLNRSVELRWLTERNPAAAARAVSAQCPSVFAVCGVVLACCLQRGKKMSERMLPVTGATLASPCQTRSSCMSELMRNKSCDIDRAGVCEPLDGLSISCCISEPETNREGLDDSASLTPRQTTSAAHLPHDVVRHIAQYALQTGGRQHSILALLAMCGVCKHWRQAASHLEKGSNLVFDGTKATTACDKTSTHGQKFRSLSQPERSRVLRAAARLLRGAFWQRVHSN